MAEGNNEPIMAPMESKTNSTESDMNLDFTLLAGSEESDDLNTTCPRHQGKLFEYFCNVHNELCCQDCLNSNHRSCRRIKHIPDEYNHLMTELKALVSNLTTQQEVIFHSTKDNDKYQSESFAGIRELRKEFDKFQDKYEENSVMKVTKLHHDNSEEIKTAETECRTMLSDLDGIITGLDAKAKGGKNNQLFVDIQMSRKRLSDMKKKASDVTDSQITGYVFYQDEKIKEIMSTMSVVWSLSIRQGDKRNKVRYIRKVNVKSDDDKVVCRTNGIAVLAGGDVVMTDCDNKSLKMIDMKQNKVISRISLSSKPYGVINKKLNQVAVSLGREGKIEIFTVTGILSRSITINVHERNFHGMCYTEDKFLLTYYHTGLVKVVDMSGRVLSNIATCHNGGRLFTTPRHIALGRNGDVAYVTDQKAHTVTTMTLSGHVISVYKSGKLKSPLGIAVGSDHNVYVCSSDSHTVIQLSATGEFRQVLLDQGSRISFPRAIAYDDTNDCLYIGSGSNSKKSYKWDSVKLFQIE